MKTAMTMLACPLSLVMGLLAGTAAAAPVEAPTPAVAPQICGDYVEARTASVFAGACHFNGELVTIGHDAVAGWNINAGSFDGVSLSGVRAMAAITSDENLGEKQGNRHSELLIDSSASADQTRAFTAWIAAHPASFGKVSSVRRGVVSFAHPASAYAVSAEHFATIDVQSMPNNDCCKQPNLVWYAPLLKLEHRKVGYTVSASYEAGTLADPWQRAEENSAFYGSFAD